MSLPHTKKIFCDDTYSTSSQLLHLFHSRSMVPAPPTTMCFDLVVQQRRIIIPPSTVVDWLIDCHPHDEEAPTLLPCLGARRTRVHDCRSTRTRRRRRRKRKRRNGTTLCDSLSLWFAQAVGLADFFSWRVHFISCPTRPYSLSWASSWAWASPAITLTDQLTQSILQWSSINSEVLLLVFLPGLILRDAFNVNFFLFGRIISQIIVLTFPMVLAGTCLAALVARFVFPYHWSWNLARHSPSNLSSRRRPASRTILFFLVPDGFCCCCCC